MELTLKIVLPDSVLFEGKVSGVVLPTAMGEIGILAGHLPLLGVIEAGAISYCSKSTWTSIAVDAGFFQVAGDQVSILTEAAIDMQSVDANSLQNAIARAEEAIKRLKENATADVEELERLESILRFNMAQKLIKQRLK